MMDLAETLRLLFREEVRQVLREELHPEWLTPAQAGEVVGVSAKTIRAWVRQGKLSGHGPGKPRVSRKELLELLAAPKARARPLERVPSAEDEMRRLHRRTG